MRLNCTDQRLLKDKFVRSAKLPGLKQAKGLTLGKCHRLNGQTDMFEQRERFRRRHKFPSETHAEVLTNIARGILQNACSCAEPKGPWKLGELTEYGLVHMVLTVSLSRDFSIVRWEVWWEQKISRPHVWLSLEEPWTLYHLKTGHSQGQNHWPQLARVLRLDWVPGGVWLAWCGAHLGRELHLVLAS